MTPHPSPREKVASQGFQDYCIAAVIPCYRVEREIQSVLQAVPAYIKHIIVVDDGSPDSTADRVAASAKLDGRILLIRHPSNQGVGGALVTGYRKALELEAQIVVKIDGDGQMDMDRLPDLLKPLIEGQADYSKGNRFRDFKSLQTMPLVRRIGNLGLGFLSKAATGYWNMFDPTNGFIAIRSEVLAHRYAGFAKCGGDGCRDIFIFCRQKSWPTLKELNSRTEGIEHRRDLHSSSAAANYDN